MSFTLLYAFKHFARQSAHLPCRVEEGEPKISCFRDLPATPLKSTWDSGVILDSLIPNQVPHPDPKGPQLPFSGVEVFQGQGQRDASGQEPWTAASLSEAGPRPARCLMSLQGQRSSSRADCVSSEHVYLTNSGCTKSPCQPRSTATRGRCCCEPERCLLRDGHGERAYLVGLIRIHPRHEPSR